MRRLPGEPRVAVLGATGAVGRAMLSILSERRFPASEVRAIATARSAGRKIPYKGATLAVETLEERGLEGIDLVLVDTPDEVALELVPKAVEAGAMVVDNSAAWRMEEEVPLVVPEVNPHAIQDHRGIIASPNCTTIAFVVPLAALHRGFGLESAVVSSYQSVSGAGQGGIEELREQAGKLSDQIDALALGEVAGLVPESEVFPAQVAFNVIPLVGSPRDQGYTGEEWKLVEETRKIMGLHGLSVSGTCVRVPAVVGHGVSVHARFEGRVEAARATELLAEAPGVEVVDLPTTLQATGRDVCLVGRIRQDPHDPQALWFFSACDNLRKGAALNAVQIAELLLG